MAKRQEKNTKSHLEDITNRRKNTESLVNMVINLTDESNNNIPKIKMSSTTIANISNCGTFMRFLADKKLEKYKLHFGIFCKNRFCPICSKKKAKRDAVEIKIMTDYVKQELNREYIFVTLTAPNVSGEELSEEITRYNKAVDRLFKRVKYKKVVKGYIRKLEVTYNNDKTSKSYNTYHPHFHILISVDKRYFKDNYISQNAWLTDWQEVMQDSSITQVDVRRLQTQNNDNLDKSILELTKYIAKDSNYLVNEQVFEMFYKGLKGKRQYAYGGDFKIARDKLKNGELEEYYLQDDTEWYWLVTNVWENGKYSEEKEKYVKEENN